jgi:hypothetical protein
MRLLLAPLVALSILATIVLAAMVLAPVQPHIVYLEPGR